MADPPPSTASNPDDPTLAASPSRTAALAPDEHPKEIGPFRILAKIAEGGMGVVYKAEQLKPVRRAVALKVIKLGMHSREVVARFEAERQALAMMDHPNIAKVFDGGLTPSGQPYFVMELIEGLPLLTFCDNGTLTSEQRLDLFIPICHALQHAHQKGIIHRDLKPSNILVTLIDGKPVPKVIDFGVAKATGADGKLTESTLATQLGFVVGTLEYMSPEQAGVRGAGDIDTRADIYSLGVILYELVTGLRPLDAKRLKSAALAEMIRIVQEEEPSKPSTRLISHASLPALAALRKTQPSKLMALLRGELDWIVMKCLEKDRERRYATANALGRDIQRYLADEPVEARPPTARYRLRKFVIRHKRPVLAATLVMLALIGGTIGTTMGMLRANKARHGETLRAQGEQAARQDAFNALHVSRTLSARLAYERAQQLCEQDQLDLGMLWFGRALEVAPEDAPDLDRAIRTSMAAWARGLYTIRMKLPQSWTTDQVKLSPDGRIAWTRERDGSARLDDATTGRPLVSDIRHRQVAATTTPSDKFGVANGYFNHDGTRLLSTGDDNTARLLDTATGRTLLAQPGQVVGGIGLGGVVGGIIATTNDGSLFLWDTSTGHQHGQPMPLAKPVRQVGFDPKDQLLFIPSAGTIRFIDIASGQPAGPDIAQDGVVAAHCTPDGRSIIGGNEAGDMLWLWDLATRRPIGEPLKHSGRITNLSFDNDGKRLLTLDTRRQFYCWDVTSGRAVRPPLPMPSADFGDAKLHPHGKLFLTATQGNHLRLWDAGTGLALTSPCPLWTGTTTFAFDGDGRTLITGFAGGGQPVVWSVGPGLTANASATFDVRGQVWCLRSTASGATVISGTAKESPPPFQSSIRVYDATTGRPRGQALVFPTPQHASNSAYLQPAAAMSPDGKLAACAFAEKDARLWSTDAGPEGARVLNHGDLVCDLTFSPDGRHVATAGDDQTVRLWDTSTGQPIGAPMKHEYAVEGVAFSPDGGKLLAWGGRPGSIRGEARLWDVATCRPAAFALSDDHGEVHDAAFSPDGTLLAIGDFRVRLWDTRSGRELDRPFAAMQGAVRRVAFSPSGGTLLAVLYGRLARLFDVATGQPIGVPMMHDDEITDAAFGGSTGGGGLVVATASYDGTSRLWDAATGLPIGPRLKHAKPVRRLCFVCKGSKLLTGSEDQLLQWDIPSPLEGDRKRLILWTQVATSYELDAGGVPVMIGLTRKPGTTRAVLEDHWLARSRQLAEMGGPPTNPSIAP
jgi:WD40 repeat protein/serine/threonine protein kinase